MESEQNRGSRGSFKEDLNGSLHLSITFAINTRGSCSLLQLFWPPLHLRVYGKHQAHPSDPVTL